MKPENAWNGPKGSRNARLVEHTAGDKEMKYIKFTNTTYQQHYI